MARKSRGGRKTIEEQQYESLLILECDADRLVSEGKSFAGRLESAVRKQTTVQPVVIRAMDEQQLLKSFASCSEQHDSIDVVMVVGHSNRSVLQLHTGKPVSWPVLAEWIKPLKPKMVFLAACMAANKATAQCFFNAIPSLDVVLGSPVSINERQLSVLELVVPYLMRGWRWRDLMNVVTGLAGIQDADVIASLNLLNQCQGGFLVAWTRESVVTHDLDDGTVDVLQVLRKALMNSRWC